MRSMPLEVTQASQAPQAPASATPQATAGVAPPAIPALPARPGAPTGGTQTVIVDRRSDAVIAGSGQGGGIAGTTASTQNPPDLPFDPSDAIRAAMEGAIPLAGIFMSMLAIIFVGWPLARAFARRLDKRAEIGMIKASDVLPQIRQLQESVDAMAVELERISEAQRFQAKLMAEKSPAILPQQLGPRA